MTQNKDTNWIRKWSLIVANDTQGIDLSEMHVKFKITAMNEESPNTGTFRVYNLSPETVKAIISKNNGVEYTKVQFQAGYENGAYGQVFAGTIMQFRKGRENSTDTYLDILAADGDVFYNFGTMAASVAAGTTKNEIIAKIAEQMGLPLGYVPPISGGTLPRGKVFWGMGRLGMRNVAQSSGMSWTIEDGKLQMIPLKGYLPGEAVALNSSTGMIGLPEQTDEGIKVRTLLNPKLKLGGLIQIDNQSINQTIAQASQVIPGGFGQLPYNQWAGNPQLLADVTNDGFYFLYAVEHTGDNRGQEWYSECVGLALDKSSNTVIANQ